MPLNDQDRARVAEINANYYAYDNGNLMRSVRRLLSIIDRLSEQPEVVRAEWIQDDTLKDLYFCSKCLTRDHRKPKHKFCPDCGERMDADAPERVEGSK